MMSEDSLRDKIYDAIVNGRNTFRVISIKKPVIEGGATFLVSFLLNLNGETHAALCADANKWKRTTTALLRRHAIMGFRECFSEFDADVAEADETE
jgi:hypothetical protein